MWRGNPVLFDAIEFDDRMATIDTLYDLAFLLMDLDHRGQQRAANTVFNHYLWHSQSELDLEGLAALPLFMSVRAVVRAMVAAQRAEQQPGPGRTASLATARNYLETALAHLEPSPPRLVAIGGLSGTGKSTLAAALAPEVGRAPGAVHLRSDVERKAMHCVAETVRLPPSAYSAEATEAVYGRLIKKAEVVLSTGYSVIADAVYSKSNERQEIEAVARRCNVPFTGLWLEAPLAILRTRVNSRRGDASDATSAVVDKQSSYELGKIGWAKVDASGDAAATLNDARQNLQARVAP